MKVTVTFELTNCIACRHSGHAGHFKYGILHQCQHRSLPKRRHINPDGPLTLDDEYIPDWCPLTKGEAY